MSIRIEVSSDELVQVCEGIASELQCDMIGYRGDRNDFWATVAAWRRHAPRYVRENLRLDKLVGRKITTERRRDLNDTRKFHDQRARFLMRLVRHLPRAAVAA